MRDGKSILSEVARKERRWIRCRSTKWIIVKTFQAAHPLSQSSPTPQVAFVPFISCFTLSCCSNIVLTYLPTFTVTMPSYHIPNGNPNLPSSSANPVFITFLLVPYALHSASLAHSVPPLHDFATSNFYALGFISTVYKLSRAALYPTAASSQVLLSLV